jgi:N-acetylglucosamine-6-phosphate deacetylase
VILARIHFVVVWLLGCVAWADVGSTRPAEGLRVNTPRVVALTNVKIVASPGSVIERGSVVMRDGMIEAVGEVAPPADAVVIDLDGRWVYPGLIDVYAEMPASAFENDPAASELMGAGYWNGEVRPQVRASRVFKPDAKANETMRKAGVVARYLAPPGGLIKGVGMVVHTGEGRADESIIQTDGLMHAAITSRRGRQGYPSSPMGAFTLVRQALYDADWYARANEARRADASTPAIETNEALAALSAYRATKKPMVIDAPDELYAMRVLAIGREFEMPVVVRGVGFEYQLAQQLGEAKANVITTLKFPNPPDVTSPARARSTTLAGLMHWDLAPENAARLHAAGCTVMFGSQGLPDAGDFLKQLRVAVARGLPADAALAAVTTNAAGLLGLEASLGTISPGKVASVVVVDGEMFDPKSRVRETWVAGQRFQHDLAGGQDPRGTFTVTEPARFDLVVDGTRDALTVSVRRVNADETTSDAVKAANVKFVGSALSFTIEGASFDAPGIILVSLTLDGGALVGAATMPDGSRVPLKLTRGDAAVADEAKPAEPVKALIEPNWPIGAYGRTGLPERPRAVLFKNATVWTSGEAGVIEAGQVLVVDGKIRAVGRDLAIDAVEGMLTIDCEGKHITPGIIDAHSHIATDGGINESGQAITCEVRIGDFIDPTDINIYRQLGGGVTAANILHGSANPIGGQNQVIKMRWGALPEELKFENAPPGVKMALGENVKQSNWGDNFTTRYPQTRMGVEQIMHDAFRAAKDYERAWKTWNETKLGLPPRRDLELEALVEIVNGTRMIHCHSYRQDEILALMRTAEKLGMKIHVFQHILEGYKVAPEMARHGAMASAFSDWWAFKIEVYDAIPYAGAIMHDAGVNVSFNSDDAELARRMNLEAAKATKYGGVDPVEALKFVTLNPAMQLGVAGRVGSIEAGKDADLVVWSGPPMSVYSTAQQTWIDGRKYFDRADDLRERSLIESRRVALIQRALGSKQPPAAPDEFPQKPSTLWPRLDEFCTHSR